MASTAGRIALILAWVAVTGGLAGGAVYLHVLGPLDGPPDFADPEPAPALPEPPPASIGDVGQSAPEPMDSGIVTESDLSAAAPTLSSIDTPSASVQAIPSGLETPPAIESLDSLTAADTAAERVPAPTGDGAPSARIMDDSEALNALISAVEEPSDTVQFEPSTSWPVRTPSLHGPMPMIERRPVDLASLGAAETGPPPTVESALLPDQSDPPDAPESTVADVQPDHVADVALAPPPPPDPPAALTADAHVDAPTTAGLDATAQTAASAADAGASAVESAVASASGALSVAPDERIIETAEVGPLPVVGPTGERPWEVYARPFDSAAGGPVVAIVIGGLGLSSAATEAAIQSLPGAVTLSFSPYSGRLNDWVALARAAGHEVLIDLPMEPADFPNSDPGPQALMTALDSADNMRRLEWVLSRATNYVGVGSYMGSRFAADAVAMRPILETINARGLIYLDNGQAIGNVAISLSAEIGLPLLVTDLRVDSQAARVAIDQALAEIEERAMRDGAALAVGTAYPVTIERLAVWARGLSQRGIALAPASALVGR